MVKKLKSNYLGFTLVELIVVVAIIAILITAITPAYYRHLIRTRKQIDVNNGEELCKALQSAMASDPKIMNFVWIATSNYGNNMPRTESDDMHYRVLAYANVATDAFGVYQMQMHIIPTAGITNTTRAVLATRMEEYLDDCTFSFQFGKGNVIDQWIICADIYQQLYVFIGAGLNDARYHIRKDGKLRTGDNRQEYMIYPEVSEEYQKMYTLK